MTGVILCGGESIRMGSDKGLLQHNSITWTEIALNKFIALKLPVLLSVNNQQHPEYLKTFSHCTLVKDEATLDIGGPLRGILSAHLFKPGEDLLVTACDMPDMHSDVFEHLIAAHESNNAEAFAFRNEEHIEPLSAIYTATGLNKIMNLYTEGNLAKFSLHHVLSVLNTHYLQMPIDWKSYFYNFNTPQDLRGK